MNFLNIGKANAEIERLKAELSKKDAELKAHLENAAELEKAAEASRAESEKNAKEQAAKIELLEKQVAQAQAEAAKAKSDADAHCKDFDANVEKAAAEKAAAINANLGVPPATTKPDGGTKLDFASLVAAKMASDKISKGKAIELCIKSNPAEYTEWRNSGKTNTL